MIETMKTIFLTMVYGLGILILGSIGISVIRGIIEEIFK